MFDTIGQKLRDLMIREREILLRVYACAHHRLVSLLLTMKIENEDDSALEETIPF